MRSFFKKLYTGSFADFTKLLSENLKENKKTFVVTANPEIFICGKDDPETKNLLLDDETTIVPDGISIVKGARVLGFEVQERIPGVELAAELLKIGSEQQKTAYLFGAKPEVMEKMREVLARDYKNLTLVGYSDGYVKNKDKVFEEIKALSPDICLVALGVPAQEMLIYKYIKHFDKGIFMGVGGSFDVLSGCKKRASKFFIKHNLEWLYRIACEPKRIKRFYNNNVKFLKEVKKEKYQ